MLFDFLKMLVLLAPEGGAGDGGGSGGAPSTGAGGDPEGEGKGNEPKEGEKGGNDNTPSFFSQFRKENREKYKALSKFKSLDELADSYLGLSSYEGRTVVPNKDASKEEIRSFLTQLGVPESEDGYTYKEGDNLSPMEAAMYKSLRTAMFKNGLTDRQATAMYAFIKAANDTGLKQVKAAQEKVIKEFDGRFEKLFDDYKDKAKREAAMKSSFGYFKKFLSSTGLAKAFKDSGLLYDEHVVKALGEYQEKIDGRYTGGNTSGSSGGGKNLFKDDSKRKGSDWEREFGKR